MSNSEPTVVTASRVLDAIVNQPPCTTFLEQTESGLAPAEMAELVRLLRQRASVPKNLEKIANEPRWPLIDVCGTGGTSAPRLNTSTLVALFLPNFGIAVSKHGGRSASGRSGSWDLLEALVLRLSHCFDEAGEMLRSAGLCYLSAALTYAEFARYAPVRKAFGRPSLFNMLGPLLNPTPLGGRLLGCWNFEVQDLLAETVLQLNETALLVVSHDDEGFLDEAAPWSLTRLIWVHNGQKQVVEIPPQEEKPGLRANLFADGIAAAKAFLEISPIDGPANNNPPHVEDVTLARRLVGWNVALGVWLAKRLSNATTGHSQLVTSENTINPQEILSLATQIYGDFSRNFPRHLSLARQRLRTLSSLQAVHPSSPTLQLVASEISSEECSNSIDTPKITHARINGRKSFFPWSSSRNLLIAEIKLQTPTREFANTLSLRDRVESYAEADALSVVTHRAFGGSVSLLQQVRALTSLPILAKDFVTTHEEIAQLIAAGANGVLLLLDLLGEEKTRLFADYVTSSGAVPFVESSFEIPCFGTPMLNSRNLFSLQEGAFYRNALARRLLLSPYAGKPFVLASSFEHPLEINLLQPKGGAVVVGGALMKLNSKAEIEKWLKQAKCNGVLKVCGAQNVHEVREGIAAGATLVGINLIPTSKRFFGKQSEAVQKELLESSELRPHLVYLTSQDSPPALLELVQGARPWWEQAYGQQRLLCEKGNLPPYGQASTAFDTLSILESAQPGSGKPIPYEPAKSPLLGQYPSAVLCASGITADNARQRLHEALHKGYCVAGLDVASGAEKLHHETRARMGFNTGAIAQMRSRLNEFFTASTTRGTLGEQE